MSTSSISSLLSSLSSSSTDALSQLLGTSSSSSSSSVPTAVQEAVNAILNSATSTSGSGIDVQSTVDALLEIEAAPEKQLQDQVTTLDTQNSALQTLESDLEALQQSVWQLTGVSGGFGSLSVSSSDNDVVSATAANGTTAGTHTVQVNSLATTAAEYSTSFSSSSATLSTGSFDLLVGTASDTNQPVTISIDADDGTNTLTGLADYINQHDLGVTASVVTDASGARLALVSQTSGSAGALTISNDTTGTSGDGMGFTQAVDASGDALGADASLTVDGIPITSSSNTVTGVISGVTLTLSSTSSSPVTIQVQPDPATVATDINDFVSAYNTVISDINTQNAYDTSTSTAGTLLGDSGMDLVQGQLLSDVSSSITGNSGYVNLASIGISLQSDGTLSVDSTALNNALSNNFAAVQNLFQSTSPDGVAQTLNQDLLKLTSPATGPLYVEINGNKQEIDDLNDQITDFQSYLQDREQQLLTEYSQINTTLEELPQTLASINAQLDALSGKSSG